MEGISFLLQTLPRELREQIYKECLTLGLNTATDTTAYAGYRHPVQCTPPLLTILESNPSLHDEALQIFYGCNAFVVHKNNFDSLHRAFPQRMLTMIKHLHIEIEDTVTMRAFSEEDYGSRYLKFLDEFACSSAIDGGILGQMVNLETILVQWNNCNTHRALAVVEKFLQIWPSLNTLHARMALLRPTRSEPYRFLPIDPRFREQVKKLLDFDCQVLPPLTEGHITPSLNGQHFSWTVWKAGEGKVLTIKNAGASIFTDLRETAAALLVPSKL